MKLCVKKLYCPTCRRLTTCGEKSDGGKLRIVCYRCGNQVFALENDHWRYVIPATK
jgi:hypothetical protein